MWFMERKITKIVRFLINPFCFGLNGRKMTENTEMVFWCREIAKCGIWRKLRNLEF